MSPRPLRILVVGASGLIGGALARALAQQGHSVVAAVRTPALHAATPATATLQADLAEVPPAPWWAGQLRGMDLVVNAVGIFREHGRQRFDTLHARGPIALFEGAAQAGVPRAVQVSALGSGAQAASAFHRSKHAADAALRALPLRSLVVQPSLVYAPAGASTRLFHGLAALPLLALPATPAQVQPLHLDDLVQAVLRWIGDAGAPSMTLAAVGPQPLGLAAYLATLRRALGWRRPAWVLPVPPRLAEGAAGVLGRLPGSTVDAEAVRMLVRGNTADAAAITGLLGRPPRAPAAFVAPTERPALRQAAVLRLLLPLGRASVAAVWLWTAAVSLGLYPVAGSLALLADFGLHGAPARVALYAGALLDLALGVATLLAPRRHMGRVWCALLLVIAGYTALITLRMPHWWLHPYGPLSKNLPMLALIGVLWATQRDKP
ncbi:oxidoreductase [Pseudorhodoferax aquiterrae]|uniref:Oxidoreductase n=1 Tax=Pseudorhodoferax aquiterrae TaxID=747304 RepID=A0ABQ3G6M9_9BURK|nr:SDR family oxidoreductase [Pseudorhodoferax aquiterrae]GHC91974.1 oxidoreductase [Pseudorhodoferax aquiterrae]